MFVQAALPTRRDRRITMGRRRQPNTWVVKTREVKEDGSEGGHWKYYLPGDDCSCNLHRPYRNWGGDDWIMSSYSKKLIRDEVLEGDLVVCYQTDGREILGFTRMASDGKEESRGTGEYNCFDLVNAIRTHSPQQAKKLGGWFTRWGYNVPRVRRRARS
jgi:hypothetical protein